MAVHQLKELKPPLFEYMKIFSSSFRKASASF